MLKCEICLSEISMKGHSKSRARMRLFCSRNCSARFTNAITPRRNHQLRTTPETTPEGLYKHCFSCNSDLPLDRNRIFCGDSCRRTFLEQLNSPREHSPRSKEGTGSKGCIQCGEETSGKSLTGRCRSCAILEKREKRIQAWLSGEWSGSYESDPYIISTTIRKYLLEKANYECSQCGYDKRHPDGSCILQINHIDGHANNHAPENLEVLCPNCHALTENHGGRNAGNGRPYRWKVKPAEPISV